MVCPTEKINSLFIKKILTLRFIMKTIFKIIFGVFALCGVLMPSAAQAQGTPQTGAVFLGNYSTGGTLMISAATPVPKLTITPAALIANHVNATGARDVELMDNTNTAVFNPPVGAFTSTVFTPTTAGIFMFRYIPTSSNGTVSGNISYYIVTVTQPVADCFGPTKPNDGANNNACNLICNPGIVRPGPALNVYETLPSIPNTFQGWISIIGSPDIVRGSPYAGTVGIYGNIPNLLPASGLSSNSAALHFFPNKPITIEDGGNQEAAWQELALSGGQKYFMSFYRSPIVYRTTQTNFGKVQIRVNLMTNNFTYTGNSTLPLVGLYNKFSELPPADVNTIFNKLLPIENRNTTGSSPNYPITPIVREGMTFTAPTGGASGIVIGSKMENTAYTFNIADADHTIDQIELLRDDFTAGSNVTVQCGATALLGGLDFCMLSDVTVRYTWTVQNGTAPLLQYTVNHAVNGDLLVNGVAVASAANIPKLTVSPSTTTMYVLTRAVVSDGGIAGFSFANTTSSVTVNVANPIPTPTLTVTQATCGAAQVTCTNIATGYFNWYVNGASPQSGPNLNSIPTSTTGTHTVVITSGGCTQTGTIAVTIPTYTCQTTFPNATTPIIGTNSSTLINISTLLGNTIPHVNNVVTGQKIPVQAALVLDVNVTFNNCEFYMFPESSITAPSVFTATGTTFKGTGCALWRGIDAPIESANLSLNSCTIQDALTGLSIGEKRIISISNNTFVNNRVGISITATNQSTNSGLQVLNFSNNKFQTLDNVSLLPPLCNTIGYAGLTIQTVLSLPLQVSGQEGYGSTGNSFYNLNYGIIIQNGTVTVGKASFNRINSLPSASAGIWATNGSTLSVNNGDGRTFNGCTHGIRTEGSSLAASNNTMTNTERGIWVSTSATLPPQTISILSNNLTCKRYGVFLSNAQSNFKGNINNNAITMDNTVATNVAAIYLTGTGTFAASEVFGNTITLQNAQYGIVLNNINSVSNGVTGVSGLAVNTNTINANNLANIRGIQISGGGSTAPSSKVRIQGNTVKGNGAATACIGIFANASGDNVISCNTLNAVNTGISFSGVCTGVNGTILRANTFGDAINNTNSLTKGLEYGSTASTGPQDFQGNKWYGTYTGTKYGAFSSNPGVVTTSPYTVNNQGTGNSIFMPTNIFPPSGWFGYQSGTNKTGCSGSLLAADGTNGLDYYRLIAQDNLVYTEYQAGLRWSNEQDLYAKIVKEPELLADPDFSDFYDTKQNEGVGIYDGLDKAAQNALEPSAAAKQQLAMYDTQTTLFSVNLDNIAVQLADTILTTAAREALQQQYDTQVLQYKIVQNNIATLIAALNADNESELNALIAANAAAPDTEIFEQNEKSINAIYFRSLAKGAEVDSLDMPEVLSIAAQCPYSGGDAVFKARAVAASFDDALYDDKSICATQGVLWRVKPKAKGNDAAKDFQVKVYPNPTKNLSTVFLEGTHSDLQLELHDVLGREIATQIIYSNATQTTVSFENNPVGLYILSLRNSEGVIIHQQKVSVIK
jgi:Secretion system C-terminal sorting domain